MTSKKYYFISLGAVLLASIYPIYMGVVVLTNYFRDGGIDVTSYPKYIIPYTPICFAIIVVVAVLPLIIKLCKKISLPVASLLGAMLFFVSETSFEKITVFGGRDVVSWQLLSCIATPQSRQTIGNPLWGRYSPAFKMHFYVISLLLILSVTSVIYGFSKMIKYKNLERKVPLITQLISVLVFIGLCIFACFTAFYRTGTLTVSSVSAMLMIIFFVVFGITAGVYFGTILYGKGKVLGLIFPAIVSLLTTIVMYIGELILMGGVLFKFGSGFLFESLGFLPFNIIDILVILSSGVATYVILNAIKPKQTSNNVA